MTVKKETIFALNWIRSARQAFGAARRVVYSVIMCWMLAGSYAMGADLVIDSFQYTAPPYATPALAQADAQAKWIPVALGNAGQPCIPATEAAVSCLSLPCAFTSSTTRGFWDRTVNLDLSDYASISVRLKSTRPSMYMTIYFQTTAGGFYTKSFYITDQWVSYTFSRASFLIEGTVSGWNYVTKVRLSCWQQADPSPATVYTSELGTSIMIDPFLYPSPAAAQAVWPSFEAGHPCIPVTEAAVSCLSLPCAFTSSTTRGYWDRTVNLDLSAYSSISVRLKSTRPSMYMTIYFQTTGGGFYLKSFNI